MNQHEPFADITSDLDRVHGGGAIGTLWKGAKAGYAAVRPVIKEGAALVKDLGVIGGAGYALKKGYEYVTGSSPPPPQQSTPAPSTPAPSTS